MRHITAVRYVVPTLLVLILGTLPAFSQTSQSEMRGTVHDESGGALPGVTVTATHVDTGAVRTAVTSEKGVSISYSRAFTRTLLSASATIRSRVAYVTFS